MALKFPGRTARGSWGHLQRLTAELVGQDDEVAILRVALADSPALFGCDRVEVWLVPAAHRKGLHATSEAERAEPVDVQVVGAPPSAPDDTDLVLPLVESESEVGWLRLVGCPRAGRVERERLAVGFAHLLSISLRAAQALGKERSLAQESMRRAHQDGLTLLGNRWLLKEWGDHLLALAAARSRISALLLFDIDGFKQINDTLGHDVGDQVLAEIGRRVRDSVRDNDLAVRLGGDEFAVLTDDLAAPADAERLAERLLDAISKPMRVDDVDLRIRSSVGIAVHGRDGECTDALLRVADQAMYTSKAEGRGRWHRFTSTAREAGRDLDRLFGEVDGGLLSGQLELYYQPQVDLASGRVSAFEALARWRHPDLGLLPAQDFLPAVERAGRTRQLTSLVLERALEDFAFLGVVAPAASMAVNVSPRDLIGHALVSEVSRLTKRYGTAPARLTVEVAEPTSGSVESRVYADLAALGCRVSISEYGSGQSSLTMLARHEAIREIKLNASLVAQLPSRPAQRLVGAVTTAAHTLGVRVVAEAVECEATAIQVRELGCDALQGSYWHAPAPASEIADWARGKILRSGP